MVPSPASQTQLYQKRQTSTDPPCTSLARFLPSKRRRSFTVLHHRSLQPAPSKRCPSRLKSPKRAPRKMSPRRCAQFWKYKAAWVCSATGLMIHCQESRSAVQTSPNFGRTRRQGSRRCGGEWRRRTDRCCSSRTPLTLQNPRERRCARAAAAPTCGKT